jgi:hypothetical protein
LRSKSAVRFLDRRRYEHAARTLDEFGRMIGGRTKAHAAAVGTWHIDPRTTSQKMPLPLRQYRNLHAGLGDGGRRGPRW